MALSALPARAHMMPAGQATLNVLEDAVFEVVSVPVSAVASAGADEDHDGRLSDREVAAHEGALVSQVVSRFKLFDGEREGTLELSIVRAEADDREPATQAGAQEFASILSGDEVERILSFADEAGIRPSLSEEVGRNDACPCGSGRKYKRCCGA